MGRALEDEGIEPALVDRLLESFTAWLTGCGIGDPEALTRFPRGMPADRQSRLRGIPMG